MQLSEIIQENKNYSNSRTQTELNANNYLYDGEPNQVESVKPIFSNLRKSL